MVPTEAVGAELQVIAQTGLTFATGMFDRERYKAIRLLAARMMATYSDADFVRVEELFAKQTGFLGRRDGGSGKESFVLPAGLGGRSLVAAVRIQEWAVPLRGIRRSRAREKRRRQASR
jgi:hypothetical protein